MEGIKFIEVSVTQFSLLFHEIVVIVSLICSPKTQSTM